MNQELKNDLNNLVHKKLYVSNFLDNEDQQKIKKIINFSKGKADIYDDLKIILSDRNNANRLPLLINLLTASILLFILDKLLSSLNVPS